MILIRPWIVWRQWCAIQSIWTQFTSCWTCKTCGIPANDLFQVANDGACLLNLCLCDPRRLPHPVILLVGIAKSLESFFRKPAAATVALLYKAVNTMDSMLGYKNERYLHFGRAAALSDDAVNFIPARMSKISLVAADFIINSNGLRAWKILRRDRRQHASPNAGYPEAAMAGALGLQLGGKNRYFGMIVVNPTIGDEYM